jgi:hypothetical protein
MTGACGLVPQPAALGAAAKAEADQNNGYNDGRAFREGSKHACKHNRMNRSRREPPLWARIPIFIRLNDGSSRSFG